MGLLTRKLFFIWLIFVITSVTAYADVIRSPFYSTVNGLSIPNTHLVSPLQQSTQIYRSSAPYYDYEFQEIKNFGITDVLIFKNQSLSEVDDEILQLKSLGYQSSQIKQIPFLWKDFSDFKTACVQTVEALSVFQDLVRQKNRKLLFHCTVGEDRTGYLAAIYQYLVGVGDHNELFREQMCQNGYGAGNPKKPQFVIDAIREQLTLYYFAMVHLLYKNNQSLSHLDSSICQQNPLKTSEFFHFIGNHVEKTHCKASSFVLNPSPVGHGN